jgi:hypothetical protein
MLLDAFTFIFILYIIMKVGVDNIAALNQWLIYVDFDLEL